MKKLGKKSNFESGTFFSYACGCNCFAVPCGTCNNCSTKNPQSLGSAALSYANQTKLYNNSMAPLTILG